MPASPVQVAALIQQPREEVRIVLQALSMLGTLHHPGNAQYQHRRPGEAVHRPPHRLSREERLLARQHRRAEEGRPSTRYAAQIAALCRPEEEKQG